MPITCKHGRPVKDGCTDCYGEAEYGERWPAMKAKIAARKLRFTMALSNAEAAEKAWKEEQEYTE